MVGSDRGKEAMAMMALHEALRNVCINSDWTYSVFWTIRPRPRSRGGSGCKVGDENGSLMLMWEDGYCRPTKPTTPRMNRMHQGPFNGGGMSKSPSFDCLDEMDADDPVRKAFRKMSIQLYNYGEGLMGKVASDKCHKWVFKEPNECEPGISNYWQSSFDAHPPEWTDQFASGIQTIVVIQAGHGLLQLGSCKIIPEDLHFVLRMRHAFDSLGYQSGYYLSQLFSGGRNPPQPPSSLLPQPKPASSPRPPIYNWSQRPTLPTFAPLRPQDTPQHHFLLQTNNNSTQNGSNSDTMVVPSPSEMLQEAASEIKWPNGLSYLTALTARADDKHLFFGPDAGGGFAEHHHHSMQNSPSSSSPNMLSKFKRSLTLPARMPQSPNSSPHLHSSSHLHHMDTQNHHDLNSPHTSQHNNNNGMDYSMSPHHQHQNNHASTTATTSSLYADMINMDSFLE